MALDIRKLRTSGAAVVEDVSLPVGMKSLARVGVLVEMRAVEVGEAVRVGREVRRHPVENDADAVLVQVVDQVHEILRRAVARGGREVSGGLVSPGTVEGMLHDGQEFDVGEAHLADVFGKARRGLAIGQRAVVLFGDAHPRAEMHFVNRLRRAQRIALGALLHPFADRSTGIRDPRRRKRCAAASRAAGQADRLCRRGIRGDSIRCETCRARPWSTPGMKPSQMPEEPRGLRRCVLESHPLKLPTTETERALGAQTLKTAPASPLCVTRWAPIFSYMR